MSLLCCTLGINLHCVNAGQAAVAIVTRHLHRYTTRGFEPLLFFLLSPRVSFWWVAFISCISYNIRTGPCVISLVRACVRVSEGVPCMRVCSISSGPMGPERSYDQNLDFSPNQKMNISHADGDWLPCEAPTSSSGAIGGYSSCSGTLGHAPGGMEPQLGAIAVSLLCCSDPARIVHSDSNSSMNLPTPPVTKRLSLCYCHMLMDRRVISRLAWFCSFWL